MRAVNPDAAIHRIVIVPNRSLSLTGLWMFYASIVCVTLGLALWFTLDGFWPVLVFAIVDMLGLGLCLFICWRHGCYSEMITVNGDRVVVDKGDGRHLEHREFNRYWAHLVVREPTTRLHPRHLYIRSHGQECEIGGCLTQAERETFEHRLAELIGSVGNTGSD